MEITIVVPPSVEEPLRTYAASLFFETSPYATSRAVLAALINQLDTSRLVNRDEIIQEILSASKSPVPELVPALEAAIIEKELPVEPVPSAQKLSKSATTEPFTDPKQLKVPGELFKQKASNTWLVWGWCMSSSLNPITPDTGLRKSYSFKIEDVIKGVLKTKGIGINFTTAYSALTVLVQRQWLRYNTSTKVYTLSSVAQKWVLTPKNQNYLIDKGFLDRIE